MTLTKERSAADRQLKIKQVHRALSNARWGEKPKVKLSRVGGHVRTQKERGGERGKKVLR